MIKISDWFKLKGDKFLVWFEQKTVQILFFPQIRIKLPLLITGQQATDWSTDPHVPVIEIYPAFLGETPPCWTGHQIPQGFDDCSIASVGAGLHACEPTLKGLFLLRAVPTFFRGKIYTWWFSLTHRALFWAGRFSSARGSSWKECLATRRTELAFWRTQNFFW